jgi:hypothetical protein
MNSHNQLDDMLDLSFRHTLKNWVNHQDPPAGGREHLLAAASEADTPSESKQTKFCFWWSFWFQGNQEVLNVRPIYGYALDSIYSLRANMAIL